MRQRSKINDTHIVQSVVIPVTEDFTLNSTNDVEGISLEKQVKPKDDYYLQFRIERP